MHHTTLDWLCAVVINMKGLLLSVSVLTQPAGFPLWETMGHWGVIGQPKVVTDGTFGHLLSGVTAWTVTICTLDTILTTVRQSWTFMAIILKLSDIVLSPWISKCRNPFYYCAACSVYLNVQILTTHSDMFICMCIVLQACANLTEGQCWREGGGGVESAVRSVCWVEGGVIRRPVWPKYRLQRVSLLSSCLPQLNLSSWQWKGNH